MPIHIMHNGIYAGSIRKQINIKAEQSFHPRVRLCPAGQDSEIEFFDQAGAYLGEFYDNAEDLDSATDVSLSPGGSVGSIDAALVPIGRISGTVSADVGGTLLQGITVRAFRWNGSTWSSVGCTGPSGQRGGLWRR